MGNRYSNAELVRTDALVNEGLTNREIAERLGRSEAGIRNLRYRKGLVRKAEDETKILFQKRNELRQSAFSLETKQRELQKRVQDLEDKKENVEQFLRLNKVHIEYLLTEALKMLKVERPDLFTLSGPEQFAMLILIDTRIAQ